MSLERVAKKISELLEELNIPDVPKETPIAVARMYLNLTDGYRPLNVKRDFPLCFPYDGKPKIVEINNIRFYTFCEHHMLPFFGFVHYAYIPYKQVIGLSKPARVVEHFAHRLQMQERFTHQVSETLWEIVKPVAQVVETEAIHLCSIMRGVRTPDECVRVREEKVNETLYKQLNREGHLYHLVKDLLSKTFKHREPLKHL